jgi:hypothetical protein
MDVIGTFSIIAGGETNLALYARIGIVTARHTSAI